jgi:hypothetical protein
MPIYIFALIAIAFNDHANLQTIGYYSTIAECMTVYNKIEPTIDKDYIKLDCVPVKVKDYNDTTR